MRVGEASCACAGGGGLRHVLCVVFHRRQLFCVKIHVCRFYCATLVHLLDLYICGDVCPPRYVLAKGGARADASRAVGCL